MNERGKCFFSGFLSFIFLLLLAFSFLPYPNLVSDKNLKNLFSSEKSAEYVLVFLFCAAFLAFLVTLSYLGAAFITFVVHLVQRLYFLHKLRRPMIIYNGSSNVPQQDDRLKKIKKDKIETYFLFAFCVIMIIFIIVGFVGVFS